MNLDQAVAYLDHHINLEATAGKVDGLSLDSMARLMTALGDPHLDVPVIQITGTNGKGSTAAMVTAVLSEMGLTVGTYASPHVSSITERWQHNGENITPDEFGAAMEPLVAVEKTLDHLPSWFELMTAGAYRWFSDIAADVAVVEVGKLGRFDATSVVEPQVAVITNVGFDHTDGSEGWRRDIAWEKAGIISPESILCLGETDPELEEVFLAERPQLVLRRGDDFDCEDNLLAVQGRSVALRTPTNRIEELFVSLHGAHQGDNAAIALAAAESFLGVAISEEVATAAFGGVRLPGRFEVVSVDPLVIVDGAHNPAGAEAAIATLDDGFAVGGQRVLIIGMMGERDPRWMLESLEADHADLVIACTPRSPRAMAAADLAAVARGMEIAVEVVADPGEALHRALNVTTGDDLIFAAGSLYVAGAVRDAAALLAPR